MRTSQPRFSKASVAETIERHMKVAAEGHDFDPKQGSLQVERAARKKLGRMPSETEMTDAIACYRAWEALGALREELGL